MRAGEGSTRRPAVGDVHGTVPRQEKSARRRRGGNARDGARRSGRGTSPKPGVLELGGVCGREARQRHMGAIEQASAPAARPGGRGAEGVVRGMGRLWRQGRRREVGERESRRERERESLESGMVVASVSMRERERRCPVRQ